MKIGIISDTHDSHGYAQKAVNVFNREKVEYIFHAGDITSISTAMIFSQVDGAKFIGVFGNCDKDKLNLAESIQQFNGLIYEGIYKGQIDGRQIHMTHIPYTLDEVTDSGSYDLVIYGHTHKQDIRKVGNSLVINPGSARRWFSEKPKVVVLELGDMKHKSVALS